MMDDIEDVAESLLRILSPRILVFNLVMWSIVFA
jgi:hypothetical protein